ncbi:MAG TPA: LLM class flavin-dependent oxidoreductase, partial [Ilumatobacteraceae bacterium]|nr:LLM class flavin-dependent oxidoreductase [Ilumatobacteraceae bacterium]
GPPISVGGDSKAALRRAAQRGDGWIPMSTPVSDIASARAEIEVIRQGAGRDGGFTVTVMGGPAGQADIDAYREAGVDRLVVSPWRRSAEAADGLRAFADAVLG